MTDHKLEGIIVLTPEQQKENLRRQAEKQHQQDRLTNPTYGINTGFPNVNNSSQHGR